MYPNPDEAAMTPELPQPSYYDKFLGAVWGEYCSHYLMPDSLYHFPESKEQRQEQFELTGMSEMGLNIAYLPDYKKELLRFYEDVSGYLDATKAQAGLLLGVAVRLMVSNEIMVEDLLSAVIDYLPPDAGLDNPYRAKLLAAQDYLEERQTLVNNILAGDLEGIDLSEVDQRNVARCENSNDLPGAVAAGFYLIIACKDDFKAAMKLALEAKRNYVITFLVGVTLGACYGSTIIPNEYQENSGSSQEVENNAKEIHWTALMRLDHKKYFNLKPDSIPVINFDRQKNSKPEDNAL